MNPKILLAAVLLLPCAADAGKLYKYTDAQGNVHFSDSPPPEVKDKQELAQPRVNTMAPLAQTYGSGRARYDANGHVTPELREAMKDAKTWHELSKSTSEVCKSLGSNPSLQEARAAGCMDMDSLSGCRAVREYQAETAGYIAQHKSDPGSDTPVSRQLDADITEILRQKVAEKGC